MTPTVTDLTDDAWDRAVDLVRHAGLPVGDLVLGRQRFWGAWTGGQLVGVIAAEVYPSGALVRSLAVDPAFRRQGLALALFRALETWWSQRGPLVLLTETAEGFFARQGFVVVSRDKVPSDVQASAEFQHLCPVTARVLVRG